MAPVASERRDAFLESPILIDDAGIVQAGHDENIFDAPRHQHVVISDALLVNFRQIVELNRHPYSSF